MSSSSDERSRHAANCYHVNVDHGTYRYITPSVTAHTATVDRKAASATSSCKPSRAVHSLSLAIELSIRFMVRSPLLTEALSRQCLKEVLPNQLGPCDQLEHEKANRKVQVGRR